MSQPKILLVDDRADNLLALRTQLRDLQAELLEAQSGTQALELLLAHDINLAIVDVQMPEMDGFQLAELMRGAERTRHIPIIFVTAGLHERSRVFRGYDAGAVDFLIKPIEAKILAAKARILLQLNHQQAELGERVAQLEAARQALEGSERRFRALAENISQLAWMAKADGYIYWYNRRWFEYTGTRAPEMEGWGWTAVHDPAVLPEVMRRWRAAVTTGEPFEMEFPLRGADGRFRRFLTRAFPVRDSDGRVVEWFGTNTDVTDLIEAQEGAKRSETRLRSLAENVPSVLMRFDRQQRIVYLSPRADEITGVASASFLGKTNREMGMPAPLCDRWEAAIARVFATGGSEELEFSFESPGEPRHFLLKLAAESGADGTVEHVLGVSTEITERKRAEDALRASEARFGLLAHTAGRLLRAEELQRVLDELCHQVMEHLDCQAFFNFMAEPSEGRLRLNAFAGIPAEAAAAIEQLDYGVALCGCVARDGKRLVAEDIQHSDDPRAALAREYGMQAYCCHPLLGQGDRMLGTLSFGTRTRARFSDDDIELMRAVADQVAAAVQRMEARRALTITNAQLIEADRRKNEFMATLSHELRNPLAPIKNCLYILDQAAPGGDQAHRAKAIIDRQVDQLSRLVDDLLDVTRITRNKIRLQRQPLELGDLVRRTVEDYRIEFEKAGVRLELVRTPQPVPVSVDWNRIAQAVGNLLHNAVKFTPRGGSVTASVAVDAAKQQAIVEVTDSGVGIKPELIERLFQPFTQADTTLDRSRGGLGLGLALVKGMVELHGGTVEAHSGGSDLGARFIVRLPLDAAAAEAVDVPAGAPRVQAGKVLIIEDHADAAESLRELLEFEGHEVWVAHTGPSGLKRALEQRPDVVLCDIGLPGMDGYDVARAMRAEASLAGTLLVALTGYALPEDLQRAVEAGFDRHMAKPPDLEHLREALAALR